MVPDLHLGPGECKKNKDFLRSAEWRVGGEEILQRRERVEAGGREEGDTGVQGRTERKGGSEVVRKDSVS